MYIYYAGKRFCIRSDDKKTTTYFYKNWCGYEIEVERCNCIGTQYKFYMSIRRMNENILQAVDVYTSIREAVQHCFNIIAQDVQALESKQKQTKELLIAVKQAVQERWPQ